jgi:hypothetical protein
VDSTALLTGIFGAAMGAAVCYRVVKHQWWKAVGVIAIGSASLLNIVTEGVTSHAERRARFVATMILLACFAIAAVLDARARRRTC